MSDNSERIIEILEDIHDLLDEKLNAIDWKLWELYKIARTKAIGEDDDPETQDDTETPTESKRPPRRRERE